MDSGFLPKRAPATDNNDFATSWTEQSASNAERPESTIFKNKNWTLRLSDCKKPEILGVDYELIFIVTESPVFDHWRSAIVIPLREIDETMPRIKKTEDYVVKLFETAVYHIVNRADMVMLHPVMEPYTTFRKRVPRLCQMKDMRQALDWFRYRKLPLYFRWRLFSDKNAIPRICSEDDLLMQNGILDPVLEESDLEYISSPGLGRAHVTKPETELDRTSFELLVQSSMNPQSIVVETKSITTKDYPFLMVNNDSPAVSTEFVSVVALNSGIEDEAKQLLVTQGKSSTQLPDSTCPIFLNGSCYQIDLYSLYLAVFKKGGNQKVFGFNDWAEVAAAVLPGSLNDMPISELSKELDRLYKSKIYCVAHKPRLTDGKLIRRLQEFEDSQSRNSKRQKLETPLLSRRARDDTVIQSKMTMTPKKPRSQSFSAVLDAGKTSLSVSLSNETICSAATMSSSTADFDGTFSNKSRILLALKQTTCLPEKATSSSSPPMAPHDCPLNAVASWHRSISKRRMSAPAAPLNLPVDFSKINLDNVDFVIEQLDVLQERLSRRPLRYVNDYGTGLDCVIEPGCTDSIDLRDLQRLKEWAAFSQPAEKKASTASHSRREGTNSLLRRRKRFDDQDEAVEIESSGESDLSDDDAFEKTISVFGATEIKRQNEQELEMFLMRFGPVVFFDANGRDITDSNDTELPGDIIQAMVDVQERQVLALQQKYAEVMLSLKQTRKGIKDRDLKSQLKEFFTRSGEVDVASYQSGKFSKPAIDASISVLRTCSVSDTITNSTEGSQYFNSSIASLAADSNYSLHN